MSVESRGDSPIIRLTRCEVTMSLGPQGRGKRKAPMTPETRQWTYYGIDAEGVEHAYAQRATEEANAAWRSTDPLWREAQRATIDRLLANPATRDTVLKINIKAALDAGDNETAIALARLLSPATLQHFPSTGDDSVGATK